MKSLNHYAYIGDTFAIEWYHDKNGKSQVLDYYSQLDKAERVKVMRLFKLLGDVGKIHDKTKFRYEGNHIYTFKCVQHRFLCFFVAGKCVVVCHGFKKKQQKLPAKERLKAERLRANYLLEEGL